MRAVLVVLLLAAAAPSFAFDNPAVLKRQMKDFERAVDGSLKHMFENRPFAILQEPKTAYLAGFGIVVQTEVNLYPMRMILPFGPLQYTDTEIKTEREQKAQRLKDLHQKLREMVMEYTPLLSQLTSEESVAVVIHLFNPRPYPEIPGQVVVQARRQAVLDLMVEGRQLAAADMARVITLREF